MYVYIHMCVYIYIYVAVFWLSPNVSVCQPICMYVFFVCEYVCVCFNIYIYIFVYMMYLLYKIIRHISAAFGGAPIGRPPKGLCF